MSFIEPVPVRTPVPSLVVLLTCLSVYLCVGSYETGTSPVLEGWERVVYVFDSGFRVSTRGVVSVRTGPRPSIRSSVVDGRPLE